MIYTLTDFFSLWPRVTWAVNLIHCHVFVIQRCTKPSWSNHFVYSAPAARSCCSQGQSDPQGGGLVTKYHNPQWMREKQHHPPPTHEIRWDQGPRHLYLFMVICRWYTGGLPGHPESWKTKDGNSSGRPQKCSPPTCHISYLRDYEASPPFSSRIVHWWP